jgi:hypothetical protein
MAQLTNVIKSASIINFLLETLFDKRLAQNDPRTAPAGRIPKVLFNAKIPLLTRLNYSSLEFGI